VGISVEVGDRGAVGEDVKNTGAGEQEEMTSRQIARSNAGG
jgi:hypothetical protein